ncbi:MAG: hypothetical protein ABI597_02520 [Gammaproteobacteria bacterium]
MLPRSLLRYTQRANTRLAQTSSTFFRALIINTDHRFFSTNELTKSIFQYGPKLPVLQKLYDQIQSIHPGKFFNERTVFVCGEHFLNTTISLCELLIALGADRRNIFMVGKNYSYNKDVSDRLLELGINITVPSVQTAWGTMTDTYKNDVHDMLGKAYQRILELKGQSKEPVNVIVSDDGGYVISGIDKKFMNACSQVIGVEQTNSGLPSSGRVNFPILLMAAAYNKTVPEPTMVANIVTKKISRLLAEINVTFKEFSDAMKDNEPQCGLIGLGHIGSAILLQLIKNGYKKFIIHDQDKTKIHAALKLTRHYKNIRIEEVENSNVVLANSHIVFGNTGTDVTAGALGVFRTRSLPQILIATSSGDVEFRTLLLYIQENERAQEIDPLCDKKFKNGFGAPLLLPRGGTPINFDNSEISVPEDFIQLTRALKGLGIIQAAELLTEWKHKGKPIPIKSYQLTPSGQAFAGRAFVKSIGKQKFYDLGLPMKIEDLSNISKISEHSQGHVCDLERDLFAETKPEPTLSPKRARK